jgi:type II secretory pathway component PulJ
MSSLLDIITATFIGAIVILMIIGIVFYIQNSSQEVNNANIAQMNLKEIAELLDYDLYKIGFRVPGNKIILADSTRLTFLSDIDNNGKIDTIRYFVGSPSDLSSTPNPNDRILYRLVNNEPQRGSNLGVVDFKFTYYDSTNTKINYSSLVTQTQRDRIKAIEYYVKVESLYPIEGYYPGAEIKKVVRPKNL